MKATNSTFSAWGGGLRTALGLGTVMVLFFWRSFLPGWVLFSNDGPLGVQKNACVQFPGSILGVWFDTNVLGGNGGGWPPSVSMCLRGLLGPFGYAKFIVPITLGIGGMCAWYFFRRRGFADHINDFWFDDFQPSLQF